MSFPCRLLIRVAGLFWASLFLWADPAITTPGTSPAPDVAAAQARLRVAPGLKVELWASEPLIQNPTSLSFDEHGRAYVVESHRRRTSVFDIRNFKDWVPDDLALRSVADRAAFLQGMLATNRAFLDAATKSTRGGFRDFTGDGVVDRRDLEVESERIRLVVDDDQDGRADRALTFADGFNTSVSGVAAGVLAHGSNVWFTCIPDLWRFSIRDPEFLRGGRPSSWLTNSSGLVPGVESKKLLTGFGVHVAFGGHDLHGLIKGPDGRLYFTIADRGSDVLSSLGRDPLTPFEDVRDTGAVFRCEPDGAQFEVFARGLRNPQELAFDEFGNLWTGDNNGDGGDKARWTLVLEGADYGWTIGWQWLPKMGAWNSERLWHTQESNTAAYIVPPVAHIGHGPAGIAYYPGTGLGDGFAGSFFYCDFPGGVRTFRVEPVGAFFRVVASPEAVSSTSWMEDNSATNFVGKLLWNLTPVDLAFPPGGGVVVADGFPTWEKDGKGRLWRVSNPALQNDPLIRDTQRLLAEGMSQRKDADLGQLLGQPDMRVRLGAQWELAARGEAAWPTLSAVAEKSREPRARRHAIWGLSQILRGPTASENRLVKRLHELLPLLDDHDSYVQGAAARMFGTARFSDAQSKLRQLIELGASPVAAQAVLAYQDLFDTRSGGTRFQSSWWAPIHASLPAGLKAKLPDPEPGRALSWPIVQMERRVIRDSATDPVLFQAIVELISNRGGALVDWESHTNSLVRLTCLLAERRRADPNISVFLSDSDPQLVLEAARAVHDVPIYPAMPALASLLPNFEQRQPTIDDRQWPTNLNFSRDEWLTFVLRRAVNAALIGGDPSKASAVAQTALRTDLAETVRIEALEALGSWAYPPQIDRVVGLHRAVRTRDSMPAREAFASAWPQLEQVSSTNVLLAAIRAGNALQPPNWAGQLADLNRHPDPVIRAEVKRLRAESVNLSVNELFDRTHAGQSPVERQSALRALGQSTDPQAQKILTQLIKQLVRGQLPRELQVDLLDAARASATRAPDLHADLTAWTNSLAADDPLARYRITLASGDAANGRKLFAERADWGCQRCHKLGGEGGDVGPQLTGIGRAKGAEYVLRAIVNPNYEIAAGFENLLVTRKDGTLVVGVVKAETADAIVLETPEEGRVTIPASQIESRDRGLSAMPEGLVDLMTLRELRDLMAALMGDP
ncbi:MAG TPA: PQQ-dependent sugar dehydrogenase [Verrucomicrobiota bacterium]|nr:hypothetical protein [Verrucomicrobiales bacterium]HRI15699.1 PQQ-dependent sugar dehydrogenase [Verrucomicrobiota bacterium]